MGELILHIGTPKTGTTSLQYFFADNREVLLKNGVDYVEFTPQQVLSPTTRRNGIFLSRYCRALASRDPICKQVSDFEQNYKRLADALKTGRRILLSDEMFAIFSTLAYEGQRDPGKYWRVLAQVIKELGVKKTELIIYLRRQDEYAISQWKEDVKNGVSNISFEEYINQPRIKCRLDYASMLNAIKDSFNNPVKVIVRSYNQVSASSNDIYNDFCESLGIAWDSDYIIPEKRLNESISFDMAEALLKVKLGRPGRSRDEKRVRKRLAVALCRNHPDPKGTTFFSAKEAKALVDMYSEGNRRIEEEYFDNKNLFSEEYNEGSIWHPNRFRIAWYRVAIAVISILSQMSLKTINVFKRMRRFINRLKDDRDAN